MIQNGYEWSGPAIEVYTKKPKIVGGETIIYGEIQVSVTKK
jgi:effector-binding domain-containing protein